MEKVLVTGATGYIGLHCIHQLLNQGYAVNGSVRSPERKNEIFEALKIIILQQKISIFLYSISMMMKDGMKEWKGATIYFM